MIHNNVTEIQEIIAKKRMAGVSETEITEWYKQNTLDQIRWASKKPSLWERFKRWIL